MTIEQVFKNKDLIIAQKKNAIKRADVVYNVVIDENTKSEAVKVEIGDVPDPTVINAKLVINTTNILDSHMDCHIKGIWNKSLSEIKQMFLLQEHEMEFDKIICDSLSDKLTVSVENKTFKSLGLDLQGSGEALIFNAEIKKDVNPFMFDLYKKGRVNQHSCGMRYVKMFLCINKSEPMYSQEKENWDKYYPQVANKEVADEKGYFWAVTEAKIIEGSAVVKGSNFATPTLEIDIKEAVSDTSKTEPSNDTQKVNSYYY